MVTVKFCTHLGTSRACPSQKQAVQPNFKHTIAQHFFLGQHFKPERVPRKSTVQCSTRKHCLDEYHYKDHSVLLIITLKALLDVSAIL